MAAKIQQHHHKHWTIDIDVKGIADIPKNTEFNGFDADGTSNDATGVFNYVTTEETLDSGSNQLDFSKHLSNAKTP